MPVVRGAFDKVIAPGALKAFTDEYGQLPAIYPEFMNVAATERAFEEVIITTGLATTPTKPESEEVAMDVPIQIGSLKMTILSYGLGYEVSHEMMADDLYGAVSDPASRFLAASQRDVEERIAHGPLNNAFTTQESYDGVSVINTTHTQNSGTVLANRPASAQALSFTALQASVERFRKLTTERDLKIKMRPTETWVPIELRWLLDEILGSSQKPFTAENTMNVMAGGKVGLTAHDSEYLTSATAWFNFAPKAKHQFHFFWRERPNMGRSFDDKTRDAAFMNFSRFGVVVWDWRGVDGSTG